jgi:hypothetical protein
MTFLTTNHIKLASPFYSLIEISVFQEWTQFIVGYKSIESSYAVYWEARILNKVTRKG